MLLHWLSDTRAELLLGEEASIPARTQINVKFDLLDAVKIRIKARNNGFNPLETEPIDVDCDFTCLDCGFSSDDRAVYEAHKEPET